MLTICTMNTQNHYKDTKYNYDNNSKLIKSFIKEYNVDVLGTQELNKVSLNSLKDHLKENVIGNFRFRIFKHNRFNETNSIVTKHEVIFHKTVRISSICDFPSRIATASIIMIDNQDICFINTHLTFFKKRLGKQLNKLLKLIDEYNKYPIIITGDFNCTIKNPNMRHFIKELEDRSIKRVSVDEPTLRGRDFGAIDHIFVSNSFDIEDAFIVKDEKYNFSDHYPVIVKVK